ncbi:PREDICTED: urease accessory protein D isoform X2 [Nicotiana attenuata]|uniref:urease accessory protein D isoform X2 n=1 Tax=Nicotiana attenuata TaxID=49451 RepID=UPI000904FA1A|nr:PREDICTED: urease accessory protein D isoform X2 [Nicotiana attenuata]
MERGKVIVEKVGGKSTVTKCFSKYPLKFIIPRKVGSSETDAVWIYTITYGGGIVSVYKAVGSKSSEQVLEARIGSNAFLAVIPDPVTCFSTAKYSQRQVFKVVSDSSVLLVDWITSGRHERGEKWDFDLYKSTNHIFHNGDEPLFLDTILLEQGTHAGIAERMQDYQVIAMVILLGPKLKLIQNQIQEDVKKMMSRSLHMPTIGSRQNSNRHNDHCLTKPSFVASCSIFGPKGVGVVTRIAAMTTESVYNFLQHQLSSMEPLLGVKPYS